MKRNANCKWCDQFNFCHSLHQMGDDCEGKCPAFERGKYEKEIVFHEIDEKGFGEEAGGY